MDQESYFGRDLPEIEDTCWIPSHEHLYDFMVDTISKGITKLTTPYQKFVVYYTYVRRKFEFRMAYQTYSMQHAMKLVKKNALPR